MSFGKDVHKVVPHFSFNREYCFWDDQPAKFIQAKSGAREQDQC